MRKTSLHLPAVGGLLVLLAACSNDGPVAGLRTASANNTGELPPSVVTLCKIGPDGTDATFSVSASGGNLLLGSEVTVEATTLTDGSKCVEVWRSVEPQPDPDVVQTVTVNEIGMTPGTQLEYIVSIGNLNGVQELYPPATGVSVNVNYANGAIIFFKNIGTPDMGGAGCTPGFWKQSQHFRFWTAPYTPSTQFGSVFADAFPGKTMLQVLSTGGGGLIALGRHTVAALLNAASPNVDYGMTPAEVIAAFNAAYASGDYEGQKNIFESLNERGCTAKRR